MERDPVLSQVPGAAACPDENEILDLVEGRLALDAEQRITAHVERCTSCQDLAGEVARATAPASEPMAELVRGSAVGRYLVIDRVGAGAMGIVYSAYDPELGRKVALKLLRPDARAGALRGRLLREAQALARLSHPNVVAVYDAGTLADQVFLAMEFVEGGTLAAWLRGAKRSQREILEVYRQAGEGLSAAHAAGVVHRDFKPENVLVGGDGRVKVTDFGLARGSEELEVEVEGEPAPGEAPAQRGALSATLTRTGALVGTPAYMAPEQMAGERADARSDQFAFSVALYEALYGERPFQAADVAGLSRAVEAGAVRDPPKGSRVPAWIRRVLLRGLRSGPADRWPSMSALIEALDAQPLARRRRWIAAFAITGALAIGLVAMRARRDPPCTGAGLAWGSTWDEGEAARTRAAFTRSGRPGAERTFAALDRALSSYRAAWTAMRTDACEATRVRGEQSEALLDRRMACLDERHREASALVRLLADADAALVGRSLSAVATLPSIEACANARALTAAVPLPDDPAKRREIDALTAELAEVNALEYGGRYEAGLARVRAAVARARALGYAPVLAKLLLSQAKLANGAHDLAAAEVLLHEAAATAQTARDDGTAADAWTLLARLTGFGLSRPADGHRWASYAEGAIARLGGDEEREAQRLRNLASIAWRREGKLDEARSLIERARTLYGRHPSERFAFQIASCDEGLGGVFFDMGRADEAVVLYHRVTTERERLFGPEHPSVIIALANEGEALIKLARLDEAFGLLDRAIAVPSEEPYGHGYARHRRAEALRRKGEWAAALEEDRRSLAMFTHPDEYWASWPLTGLGVDLIALGRPEEAIEPLERAARLRKAAVTSEQGETAFALARALWNTGKDPNRAVALAEEARAHYRGDADRYGSWYRASLDEIDAWLAAHPKKG